MKRFSLLLPLAAVLMLLASCANDDTTKDGKQEQEPGTEGLTSFVMGDDDEATRTTGEYDGSGINFYWTAGDRLWVNNTTATPAVLTQDTRNNISTLLTPSGVTGGVDRTATAKFWFAGNYTAATYPVRYTGKNGANNKVTINATQTQLVPNDASHIGEDGDCGIATATKSGGQYTFTLDHAAAYATFLPFTSQGVVAGAKIQKIKVSADQAICGEFNFNDSGIDVSSRPAASAANQSIELTLNTAYNNGFSIPSTATASTNAATMVIAPGSYTHFTVEYTLHDPVTNITGTITNQYPGTVTFTAGKNKRVSRDLQVTVYPGNGYYLWDAQQQYWYGHESDQPTIMNTPAPAGSWPQNKTADPDRYYNDIQGYSDYIGAAPAVTATNSAAGCPNINELRWYAEQGDPHWDNSTLWATMGYLYAGGMWFKKKANISGYSAEHAPNGIDYTRSTSYANYNNYSITQGKPAASDLGNYFYLPALGYYYSGTLYDVGYYGYYWSSTPAPLITSSAYYLGFGSGLVGVGSNDRNYGFRLWSAE